MHKLLKFTDNRVWRTYQGGKILDQIEHKTPAKDTHFPENWIGSLVEARNIGREDISEGQAKVFIEGEAPALFKNVLLENPAFYLGKKDGEVRPLDDMPLVKYLDSATRLHFQVHPTKAFAKERLDSNKGKTEAYVILSIRDEVTEPYIYAGFQRSPSRETLQKWIEEQNIPAIEACFDKIPVRPGDVVLLPGGRPHALGEGILMLEIMEPSDWAVRFEFERCGYVIPEDARFMGKDIDTALDVFNFTPVIEAQIDREFRCVPTQLYTDSASNSLSCLIGPESTDCFTVKRATVTTALPRQEDSFFIGIVAEGNGAVVIDGNIIELNQWETFFLPASVKTFTYITDSHLSILECYPGQTPAHSVIPTL